MVAYIYAKLKNTKLIIDWHNYGFSILALTNGPNHILCKICKRMEIFFGQRADSNLCVTNAMKNDLLTYNVKASTLYDKPHERFKPLTVEEKNTFFQKLIQRYNLKEFADPDCNDRHTAFTNVSNEDNKVSMKASRPALIVSSSSWTEDEDFHILIDALEMYQNKISNNYKLPNLICALTGKGPLKEYYEKLFMEKNFRNIKVLFVWLEPNDYPLLLGCSDLGVCFHNSTSSLDLPMKIVDS